MKFEKVSTHVVADASTQRTTRSCVMGGINLGSSIVAIESGDSLEVGHSLRKSLESRYKKPVQYFFLTHTHTDHRKGMNASSPMKSDLMKRFIELVME